METLLQTECWKPNSYHLKRTDGWEFDINQTTYTEKRYTDLVAMKWSQTFQFLLFTIAIITWKMSCFPVPAFIYLSIQKSTVFAQLCITVAVWIVCHGLLLIQPEHLNCNQTSSFRLKCKNYSYTNLYQTIFYYYLHVMCHAFCIPERSFSTEMIHNKAN